MTVKEASQASIVRDFNKWNVAEGAPSKVKNSTFKGVFVINKDFYKMQYKEEQPNYNNPKVPIGHYGAIKKIMGHK